MHCGDGGEMLELVSRQNTGGHNTGRHNTGEYNTGLSLVGLTTCMTSLLHNGNNTSSNFPNFVCYFLCCPQSYNS